MGVPYILTIYTLTFCTATAYTDTIKLLDSVAFGKIHEVDSQFLSYFPNCDSTELIEIDIADVEFVSLNDDCAPNRRLRGTGLGVGLQVDCDSPTGLIEVEFTSRGRPILAYLTKFQVLEDSNRVAIRLVENGFDHIGPKDGVKTISPIYFCGDNTRYRNSGRLPNPFIQDL